MAGTGAAHDAAEISFDLPDDGESDTGVEAVDTAPKLAENPNGKTTERNSRRRGT